MDELRGWMSEIEVCDGYVVLLGRPDRGEALHALGPYTGLEALQVADAHTHRGAPDAPLVRVVRLHLATAGTVTRR